MPYCSSCGVEVEPSTERCPLCKSPIQSHTASVDLNAKRHSNYPEHIIDPEDKYHLTDKERRSIALELMSLAFGLAAGALGLADLLVNHRMGWSLIALISLAFGWLVVAMPLIFFGKPWLVFATVAPALPLFLFILDVLDGRITWFLLMGLPIALASIGAIAATGAIIGASKRKGLNVVATGFLGVAAYLIVLEGIIDLNLRGYLAPYWSGIAALALAPVAVVLYFIHGRVLRGSDLRKVFRL